MVKSSKNPIQWIEDNEKMICDATNQLGETIWWLSNAICWINWIIETLNSENNAQLLKSQDISNKSKVLLAWLLKEKDRLMENPWECISLLEKIVLWMNMAIKIAEQQQTQVTEYQWIIKSQWTKINKYKNEIEDLHVKNITDKLTWIWNLTKYLQMIHSHIADYKNSWTKFCVALLDIDHFKKFNDKYWHEVWDAVLRKFASSCNEFLKEKCWWVAEIYRVWWEEFVVMWQIQVQIMYKLLQRFRLINQKPFSATIKDTWQKFEWLKITFSCWIAEFKETDNHCSVKTRADTILYSVKDNWRDNIRFEE